MSIQAMEMGKCLVKRSVFKVCIELGTELGEESEFPLGLSGGSEFQSRRPTKEKALLPSNDRTYIERTSESEDLVEK